MATKYDLFELLYHKGGIIRPSEILVLLNKDSSHYKAIYKQLTILEKEGFIANSPAGFQIIRSKESEFLYKFIRNCIQNDINYNYLLDIKLATFISKALRKKKTTIKEFKINSRTFKKYVNILSRSGLCTIFSLRPLTISVPYNNFLGGLLHIFKLKPIYIKYIDDQFFEEIKKELTKFKRLRFKNERRYNKIIEEFKIKFIHHSLSIEGNPITLSDTISLIKENITPKNAKYEDVQEVKNYQNAVEQMLKDSDRKTIITKNSILNYHILSMFHRPNIAGKIRDASVYIQGNPDYKVSNENEIDEKIDQLIAKYNLFLTKEKPKIEEIIKFASFFHNEFQHIHPFFDGNSRTTRLITFHLLRSFNIPVIDIPLCLLEEYIFSTKGAKKRSDKKLEQVLQRIIIHNLKIINEKLV